MQTPLYSVNFMTVSRSGWTWHNLWNLLTINFKYQYFHKFGQGFTFNCIFLYEWKNEKWISKNVFVKNPRPWHDNLIINSPCRTAQFVPKKIFPTCHEKILEKGSSILYGGDYALAPLENHVGWRRGYILPSILARNCRLKLVNILNLTEKFVWQNRSVDSRIL